MMALQDSVFQTVFPPQHHRDREVWPKPLAIDLGLEFVVKRGTLGLVIAVSGRFR
jgi:hypothetical protein